QKVSDKVMCVKGDTIARYGTPETVFLEDVIRDLYEIENGSYDPLFGSIEMAAPAGDPEIFVLSNCGTGISVYRHLQMKGRAFAAGILSPDDMDYAVARHLASEVVETAPFEPFSKGSIERAMQLVNSCRVVIDAGLTIGSTNEAMREILAEAERLGKLKRGKHHELR
ncbi:MAG: ABC transporter ATP-binding protein, partial [Firmicutes bacterium]|nr:ABC transporter ATP-binding protein [Bacillota bacterium]